jgi:hypothetical protein
MRNERKVMLLGKHNPGRPKIHIYTSSGILLNTLTVSQDRLLGFSLIPVSGISLSRFSCISRPATFSYCPTRVPIACTTSRTLSRTPSIPLAQRSASSKSSARRGLRMALSS